jgi:predicted DNA-binding transcriptional regulator AlpA
MKSEANKQFAFNPESPAKLPRDPNERALRLRQVSQLNGLGRSMIYQMQAEGRFPQRIKLGERARGGWRAKCETGWRFQARMASVVGQPHVNADQRSLTADLDDLVKAFASAEVRTFWNSLEWMGFRISGSPIE